MHTVFFGIKKVHWRVVGMTNRMIGIYGLTAARFELLRIVLLAPPGEGVAQGTLRWLLGVAAPTVSKMLKALEALGFIVRDRSVDRRCFTVRLTERGRVATSMSMSEMVDGKMAEWTASRGVLGDAKLSPETEEERDAMVAAGANKVGKLRGLLASLRKAFEDVAPYPHPWRLGNFLPPLVYASFDAHGKMTIINAFTGAPA